MCNYSTFLPVKLKYISTLSWLFLQIVHERRCPMNQGLAIGIDLGGTNVRIALMNSSGEMTGMYQQPTHGDRSITEILESIAEGIEHVIDEQGIAREDIVGVGLGAPGFLSLASGVIHTSPNLPTANETPVVSLLQRLTDLPVYLENDANAAAIGEQWIGAGQGSRNLLCITLGTGLGSGFILDGTIWHGSNDFAGELGHTTLFPGGPALQLWEKGVSGGLRFRYRHSKPGSAGPQRGQKVFP